jgi:hypothetical protein
MNLDDCLGGALKNVFNLMAECGGGLLFSANEGARNEEDTERETKAADGPELKPETKLRRATRK